jgi:hypothetical protein
MFVARRVLLLHWCISAQLGECVGASWLSLVTPGIIQRLGSWREAARVGNTLGLRFGYHCDVAFWLVSCNMLMLPVLEAALSLPVSEHAVPVYA